MISKLMLGFVCRGMRANDQDFAHQLHLAGCVTQAYQFQCGKINNFSGLFMIFLTENEYVVEDDANLSTLIND